MFQQQALPEQPLLAEKGSRASNTTNSIKISQAEFLTNNWRRIQAIGMDHFNSYSYYVKVTNNVAIVTNGFVMIRCKAPFPDGYYTVSPQDYLEPVTPEHSWSRYPDTDVMKHYLESAVSTPPIERADVRRFIDFLEHVKQADSNYTKPKISLTQDVIYRVSDHRTNFAFPCQLPIKGDGIVFDTGHLKLVFIEMLRYDRIHLGFNQDQNKNILIAGLGWDSCAIIRECYG